ncbi:MAG: hypothetical protein F4Y50_00215 [Dehalococcoidia bacterium]|nr:hypothetical protein [Chloroflexota bacterium]MXY37099.1 hypothetical protein [Dehalococcoidia bacterium]MXY42486.1 hypothetical protein [Dehalococcoidia bacterium]MYK26994.1 hypothetical protein [Dehalococcoidia bacterium]
MADEAYAPDPTKDHETVSIYPLDDDVKEELLNTVGEAVLNWSTKDGWPVGVMHAVVWAKGSFWMTAAAHRHRMAALRRDPRCSVVLTSTGTHLGPGKTITAKCRCVMYEDRETKDWFYHALAFRPGADPEQAAAFEKSLDSPLRVVMELVPEKWITFDGAKMGMATAGVLPDEQKGPMLSSDAVRLEKELKARGLA